MQVNSGQVETLKDTQTLSKAQEEANQFNAEIGYLTHYDCPKCKNKGYVGVVINDAYFVATCTCLKIRNCKKMLEKSGINEDYTFEKFEATDEWQKKVVAKAKEYVAEPKGWFYMGGQVGCGKTHICTSIVRELIEAGNEARYMLWREVSTKLKACVNNPEEYAGIIEPLKTVKVLYIDDFWKTNTDKPTTADANLAFEILNARYNRKDLITIISSEYYLCELADIDEAVGSRIYERAKENRLDIARDRSRNYRSRGMSKMI